MSEAANIMNAATSNEWTVVGKNKKDKRVTDAKDAAPTSPKKSQPKQVTKVPIKKVPNASNDETKKTEKEGSKSKENTKNIVTKKQNEKSKSESEKFKQPKSLEQAVLMISEVELQDSCNSMALSDIARYLNSKLLVQQNYEIYYKESDYPQSIVPSKIKSIIINAIKSKAHISSLHYCIEFCLSSIGYNMVKELPVAGYELMIQLIASVDPLQFLKCTDKLNVIMSSFQNRPPVGLSLLWGIGQGGLFNFKVGYQVWKKSMFQMIEMKHYYKYVINYIIQLLEIHSQDVNVKNISISTNDYIELITFFHTKRNGIPKDLEKSLSKQASILRMLCLEKSESWKNFKFDKLLEELPNSYSKSIEIYDNKTKEIILCAVELLKKSNSSLEMWKSIHLKYLKQSSHILKYLDKDWNSFSRNINFKMLSSVVKSIKSAYQKSAKDKLNLENADAIMFCQVKLK